MPFIETLGQQAASGAVEAGMGMLLGKYNDKRQLKQQKKLQDLQIEGNKQMGDYNFAKQLQMWKDTSYGAQKEQMIKAGLNPGLMYGMSGGGGVTTGGGGPTISGGSAPSGGGEFGVASGMGIQRGLLEAQKANIEADTKNKLVDAENKSDGGVVHTNIATQTESLSQGISNAKTKQQLDEIEKNIKGLEVMYANESMRGRLMKVEYEGFKAIEELKKACAEGNVAEATVEQKITLVKQQVAQAYLDQIFTGKKIQYTQGEINKQPGEQAIIKQKLTDMISRLSVDYEKNRIEFRKLLEDESSKDASGFPKWMIGLIEEGVEEILKKRPVNIKMN